MEKELWDLYDSCFQKTSKVHERGLRIPDGYYHLVVHIFPVNKEKQILVQKRSNTVLLEPGLWAATGGSALCGEDAWEACQRECYEEIGFRPSKEQSELATIMKRKDSFATIWVVKTDLKAEEMTLQEEEVAEVKWMYPDEIRAMIQHQTFHVYQYAEWLFQYIENIEF